MERNNKSHFFKYLSLDAAKAVLKTCTFKWSTPVLFNDPFDNQLELLMHPDEGLMAQQMHEHMMGLLTQDVEVEGLTPPALNDAVEYLRRAYRGSGYTFSEEDHAYMMEGAIEGARNAAAQMPEVNRYVRERMADTSIFCLSEVHTNPAMWSYYAGNHTGVVLKLVPPNDDSFLTVAQRVRYIDQPLRFTAADFFDVRKAIRKTLDYITLTKTSDWAHEREWRVVSGLRNRSKQFEIIPFTPEELSAVYLGCRMSSADRDAITQLVRSRYPHAEVLQARANQAELQLAFESI